MRNLSESAGIATDTVPSDGHRKYKDLFKEEFAARVGNIEKQQLQIEALTSTLKTENAMAQSAMQQVAVLSKELEATKHQLIEMRKKYEALSPPDGTEVAGE